MNAHARIAPSSLHAIVQCGAYLRLTEPFRDAPRTPEQLEGDAAHWAALLAVSNGKPPAVGTMSPQGIALTDEMVDGAILWMDVCGPYGVPEMPVWCTSIHPTECYGTPDWRRFDAIEGILRLKDYKFGFRFVEVFENWQTIAYVSGLLDEMESAGLADQHLRVEVEIVQPRSYHRDGQVRSWSFMASDIRGLVNTANAAAHRALEPNAPARVGPACYDCAARHVCPTLQSAASNLMTSHAVQGDAMPATPAAIGVELALLDDAADLIEARRTGLKAQAEQLIRTGQRVPGWSLVHAQGRETWKDDASITAAAITADMLNVPVRKPQQLITPNQARKAGLPADIVAAYAHRLAGGSKLEREPNHMARKAFTAGNT